MQRVFAIILGQAYVFPARVKLPCAMRLALAPHAAAKVRRPVLILLRGVVAKHYVRKLTRPVRYLDATTVAP